MANITFTNEYIRVERRFCLNKHDLQQQHENIQGGPYVPVLQKVVIVRLVLKISIIDTNIIQKSYKNTFFLKVTRV